MTAFATSSTGCAERKLAAIDAFCAGASAVSQYLSVKPSQPDTPLKAWSPDLSRVL